MSLYEGTIGEIALFAGNFAPRTWYTCSGQILSIAQNTAFFSILGTTYGGNGQTTFALPDLRGRVAIGVGQGPGLANTNLGEIAGTPNVTILQSNMPAHTHIASSIPKASIVSGDATTPENNYLALSPKIGSGPNATTLKTYATQAAATAEADKIKSMASGSATTTNSISGGNIPISIMQPYLGLTYIICYAGIFPSRN